VSIKKILHSPDQAQVHDVRIALAEMVTRQDSVDSDLQEVRHAVINLGKRIDEMGSSINAKIDQRSQPQWQTYIAGAMLLGAMFFAFINPLKDKDNDLDRAILKVEASLGVFEKRTGDDLAARNLLFVSQTEHKEYRTRIDEKLSDLSKEIGAIESTRPTTGELKGLAAASESLANKLDERVRSLETFVRQPSKP